MRSRKQLRLKNYDYSAVGYYFVTICIQNRVRLFGEINENMVLNAAGRMIKKIWNELPIYYPVQIDEFVVMPDHIHGIIKLSVGAGPRARPISLPDIVQRFKSLTTTQYKHHVITKGWLPFNGRLWQRNYYEHIIRDEIDLNNVRRYIQNNPNKWIIKGQAQGPAPT